MPTTFTVDLRGIDLNTLQPQVKQELLARIAFATDYGLMVAMLDDTELPDKVEVTVWTYLPATVDQYDRRHMVHDNGTNHPHAGHRWFCVECTYDGDSAAPIGRNQFGELYHVM